MCFRRFCTDIPSTPWVPLFRSTLFRAERRFPRDSIRSINIRYASFREQLFLLCQLCSTILKSPMEFTISFIKYALSVICVLRSLLNAKMLFSQLFTASHLPRVCVLLCLLLTPVSSAISYYRDYPVHL